MASASRVSKLTDARLDSLYTADDFGAEKTMRARVIRELIDEIRLLRREAIEHGESCPGFNGQSFPR